MNRPITFRTLLLTNGMLAVALIAILLVSTTLAGPGVSSTPAEPVQHAPAAPDTTLASMPRQATADSPLRPFQGMLTDSNGTPITDTVTMSLALYPEPSGGTAVWQEERSGDNAVTVTNGLFTVMLGSVEPISTTLLTQPLWLGISVNGDAEMEPRQRLRSVPMAENINQPLMTLLGEKTCSNGSTKQESSGWMPMMCDSVDDPIKVVLETHGGPLLVHMTGSFATDLEAGKFCAIRIEDPEDSSSVRFAHVAGNRTAMKDYYCSGSYLFTDLPAGRYAFVAYGHVGGSANELTWGKQRQIAVYEFMSPGIQ